MTRLATLASTILASALLLGCAADGLDDSDNPFLDDQTSGGKEDTGYANLRGVEVEVTLQADVEASQWQIFQSPPELAQFAVTYLREKKSIYLEILAEDATAPDRVEWLVDGEWLTSAQAREVSVDKLRTWRMQGVNVVLMYSDAANVTEGTEYQAEVPIRPYEVYSEASDKCADPNSHLGLSQSIYWYLWNPDRSGCELETQQMSVRVDRILPSNPESYPEYDKLWADNQLDVVVFWGKLDDGDVEDDYNWRNVDSLARYLEQADFVEADDAPRGRRFEKSAGDRKIVVDIYGPDLFHSVADYTRFDNWQKGVTEHEVVIYNGHSVLGSGMAFERVVYPDRYQIFQVASCLSYEYYVRPILAGKGGWENVDVISNVTPTYYSENLPLTSTVIARLIYGFENGGRASWQDIMERVSQRLGHPRFGVSGARGNCFSPEGDRCGEEPPPDPDEHRYTSTEPVSIPDNDPDGVTSTIEVPDSLAIGAAEIEIDLTHTWIGDLRIEVSHGDVTQVIWDRAGSSDDDIRATFPVASFSGADAAGTWTVRVSDNANADTGVLNSWAVVVTPAD